VDASSCEFDAGKLPDSEGKLAHVLGWAAQLGMSAEEIVALMGAHTLGRAVAANSGYEGEWVPQDAVLDNVYYVHLVRHPWNRTSNDFTSLGIGRTTTQWNDQGRMMLTTDMVLAFALGDTPNAVSWLFPLSPLVHVRMCVCVCVCVHTYACMVRTYACVHVRARAHLLFACLAVDLRHVRVSCL